MELAAEMIHKLRTNDRTGAYARRPSSVLRRAHHREHLSRGRATVDKIEVAKRPEFNKAQQCSTSCLHLLETEAVENRALSARLETVLGAGGRAFKSPRPDQREHLIYL